MPSVVRLRTGDKKSGVGVGERARRSVVRQGQGLREEAGVGGDRGLAPDLGLRA